MSSDGPKLEDGLGDWRYRAVTTLVNPLPDRGPGHRAKPAGSVVAAIRRAETQSGEQISFTDFSTVALSLSVAMSADARAQELRASVRPEEYETETGIYKTIRDENIGPFFDFLEQVMIAMIFSYQALEAYCNATIQDKLGDTGTYEVTRTVAGQKQKLAMQAAELERRSPTSEKLAEIVPKLLGMGSPKGKAVWANFVKLERVRDGIIHMKHANHQATPHVPNAINANQLFLAMIKGEYVDLPKTAVVLLDYFTKHSGSPRWLHYPLEQYSLKVTEPQRKQGTVTVEPQRIS